MGFGGLVWKIVKTHTVESISEKKILLLYIGHVEWANRELATFNAVLS